MPKIIENPQAIIMEHAGRILAQEGYEALNMRAIAKSCGIATGTIYNYYPTKRDLLLQMMTDYWEINFATIEKIASSDEDLFAKIKSIFVIMENFIHTYREIWMNMRQETDHQERSKNLHHNHDYMRRLLEHMEHILILEEKVHPNKFHYPLPVSDMASFILQNLLAICHSNSLSYEAMELLIRKVLV